MEHRRVKALMKSCYACQMTPSGSLTSPIEQPGREALAKISDLEHLAAQRDVD